MLESIARRFAATPAVADVSLTVDDGEVVCLVGPSGCGKTTTLRIAAGVERPESGRVFIGGRLVAGDGRFIPPEERSVGLVFQDFALFPHLKVIGNVAFGITKCSREERRRRALEALDRVRLRHLANAYPHELSGGEQQRVALARALAPRPQILLMDEPFSGLDLQLRQDVRTETLRVLRDFGIASLIVTHDPEEALQAADRIVLLRAGRVAQTGLPETLWSAPADAGVARFFSSVNELVCLVARGQAETPFGPVAVPPGIGAAALIVIRPHAFRVAGPADGPIAALIVEDSQFLGAAHLVSGTLAWGDGPRIKARLRLRAAPDRGDELRLLCAPEEMLIFPLGAD